MNSGVRLGCGPASHRSAPGHCSTAQGPLRVGRAGPLPGSWTPALRQSGRREGLLSAPVVWSSQPSRAQLQTPQELPDDAAKAGLAPGPLPGQEGAKVQARPASKSESPRQRLMPGAWRWSAQVRLALLLGPEPARPVAGRVPWTRAACAGLVPPGARWGASQILPAQDPVGVHPEFRPLEPAPASRGLVLCPVSGAAGVASRITCSWLPLSADAAPGTLLLGVARGPWAAHRRCGLWWASTWPAGP